jgi:hypothetical protein
MISAHTKANFTQADSRIYWEKQGLEQESSMISEHYTFHET